MENQQQIILKQEVDAVLATLRQNVKSVVVYKPLLVRLFQARAFPEAIRLLSAIVGKDPKDVFAQLNLAQAFDRSGRLAEAEKTLVSALQENPESAEIYLGLSQIFQKQARIEKAVKMAQAALRHQPNFEAAHLRLAELYLNSAGCLEKAEGHAQRVMQLNPKHPSASGLLGVIYLKNKKYVEAEEAVMKSLAVSPNNAGGYANLSLVQSQVGKLDEAEANARKAIALAPQFHKGHSQLGHVLHLKKRYAEAEAAYTQSVKLMPGDLQTHVAAAAAIVARGDTKTGFTILKNILESTKNIDYYHQLLYAMWPILQDPAFINLACDIALHWRHGASEALAIKSILLNDIGDTTMLPKLCNFDALVKPQKITTPIGFDHLDAFNDALVETLRNAKELEFESVGKAIIGGARLQNMGAEMSDATRALYALFQEAVDRYGQDLSASPAFPFLQQKPEKHTLYAWGNILQDRGYEFAHYHASGWISGVYYPKLPAVLSQENPGREGWIEFGAPREDLPFKNTNWKTKAIKPEAGLMILFPSFMWHRTIPYTGNDERISIAFDAVPVR